MDALRNWIIDICTTVFFITAVEMILPDNNLKKYCKFVLGLILMTVIINPLVKFLNEGSDITAFVNNAAVSVENQIEDSTKSSRESSLKDTLYVFKLNLEKLCVEKLKERYPKDTAEVDAKVAYDEEKEEFVIESISVRMDNRTISKIEKVDIKTSSSSKKDNLDDSQYGLEVRDYLSTVLDLPEEKILVYKLQK
ncbi:stage III sporulation protein AF [Clostridium thermarum]|uniref:stage III sporulation protein AF n=1 Tax=Clostridium thermarum TaxID=1716543 RepID=UPI0013D76918|nr:stage III sporulation protein AF [Clostridium thermarum]